MNERFEQMLTGDSGDESPENFRAVDQEQNQEQTVFTPEQQQEIETKRRILSSLAYFIGKDFQIPVELNEPGKGWHWDFQKNIIRIDPKDLLDKPMDYLRFVISHEGGHRRISRTEFIPAETWRQPGFSFMMNAIEDPRDNNFVAENYPKFREQMQLAYEMNLDMENKFKEKAQEKLGHQPRFMQAGFEYIKQWFLDQEDGYEISEDLPDEVKQVVRDTIQAARDSWTTYPSRGGADGKESEKAADGRTVTGEELISEYAKASYQINLERVWPEFRKLVEKDMEDQRTQELLDEMQQGKAESGGQGLPQELDDQLTSEEQKELEKAIDEAIEKAKQDQAKSDHDGESSEEQGGESGEAPVDEVGKPSEQAGQKGKPIDLDSLSPELRQKIKDYIDSLPEDKKKELAEKAEKSISDFEKELDEELGGKLSEDPESRETREQTEGSRKTEHEQEAPQGDEAETTPTDSSELEKYREMVAETLKKDENVYEEYRREVLDVINSLENDLREIFVARRMHAWRGGFKSGKRIDIKRRIQEKAKEISAMESRAWEKRELPSEKDYAISLLVDLSGSMQGEKIEETFRAVVVLAEVLNRLSIQTEILGFNDRIYEYQKFGQDISREIRENMGGMLQEVDDTSGTGKAQWNDDGWALSQTSESLAKQKAKEKFLIVLSDGTPVESPMHPRSEYKLDKVISDILRETDQKLIGLGIGPGTGHVEHYYPNSLADVNLEEMAEKLADLIREAIANYDKF
jgi:cobalamin biosynthesis protein CobT